MKRVSKKNIKKILSQKINGKKISVTKKGSGRESDIKLSKSEMEKLMNYVPKKIINPDNQTLGFQQAMKEVTEKDVEKILLQETNGKEISVTKKCAGLFDIVIEGSSVEEVRKLMKEHFDELASVSSFNNKDYTISFMTEVLNDPSNERKEKSGSSVPLDEIKCDVIHSLSGNPEGVEDLPSKYETFITFITDNFGYRWPLMYRVDLLKSKYRETENFSFRRKNTLKKIMHTQNEECTGLRIRLKTIKVSAEGKMKDKKSSNPVDIIIPDERDRNIYLKIMKKESHHGHEIITNEDGRLAWKQDDEVVKIIEEVGFDYVLELFRNVGYNKNSKIYRKLYRDMGYTLFCYWEVFYCKMNNPIANKYYSPTIPKYLHLSIMKVKRHS